MNKKNLKKIFFRLKTGRHRFFFRNGTVSSPLNPMVRTKPKLESYKPPGGEYVGLYFTCLWALLIHNFICTYLILFRGRSHLASCMAFHSTGSGCFGCYCPNFVVRLRYCCCPNCWCCYFWFRQWKSRFENENKWIEGSMVDKQRENGQIGWFWSWPVTGVRKIQVQLENDNFSLMSSKPRNRK